jgi:hypothetical protein
MFPKPGPAGPASAPTGNPGQIAQAQAQVREAMRIMEKALAGLQPGTKPYEAVVSSLDKLGKAIPATEEIPGVQTSTLTAMLRNAKEGAMQNALQRMGGGGGGAPPPTPPSLPAGGAPPPSMQ